MNLTPLFVWGEKTLRLIENQKLNTQELELVLNRLNLTQKILKTNHFDPVQIYKCHLELEKLKSPKGLIIKEKMKDYFETTKVKFMNNKRVVCSSDIIESCFGEYKEVVKLNRAC